MNDKGLHVAGLMQFSSTGINEYNTTTGGPAVEQIVSRACSTPHDQGHLPCTWQCRHRLFVMFALGSSKLSAEHGQEACSIVVHASTAQPGDEGSPNLQSQASACH